MGGKRQARCRPRLGFKANTDDIRFAPALEIVKRLLEEGAVVHATDPEAMPRTKALFPHAHYHEDAYQALQDADAALVCTNGMCSASSIGIAPENSWRANW